MGGIISISKIKPENVILLKNDQSQQENLKLCDFGFAKVTSIKVGFHDSSCTPDYADPSLLDKKNIVDLWENDIYSLKFIKHVHLSSNEKTEKQKKLRKFYYDGKLKTKLKKFSENIRLNSQRNFFNLKIFEIL